MIFNKNEKVLFIGDSITDCGRARPIGEGRESAYGHGYVHFIQAMMTVTYPERYIRIVNMGESGNTVRDMKRRWQRDVLDLKPDWLSIMIGINDVWRQFDAPLQYEIHVPLAEYREILHQLVFQTRPQVKGIILITPYYIEARDTDAMRCRMDEYRECVKAIASEFGALLVDVQQAFNDILKHYHANAFAWDRVHPNPAGHMVIARAFLKAAGYEW